MNSVVENPNVIARYILSNISLSQKKLHKLLYFAYGWYLYLNNEKDNIESELFPNTFEAWVHGPVLRSIYPIYSKFGYKEFELPNFTDALSEEIKSFINQILSVYGELDANTLEDRSHSDIAWIRARGDLLPNEACKTKLSITDIYESFEL